MEKIITDEKFYITDIPSDYDSRVKLCSFLGLLFDSSWIASNKGMSVLSFSYKLNTYLFVTDKSENHTVITYDDLLANYLPKNTKVELLNFKVLDETVEYVANEEYQVGGTHYQKAIQPIEYIEKNKLGFCEGNVVKYVSRHKEKNGAEDIKKAIQYLEFILKYQYGV